jgi:hypothetical protein
METMTAAASAVLLSSAHPHLAEDSANTAAHPTYSRRKNTVTPDARGPQALSVEVRDEGDHK